METTKLSSKGQVIIPKAVRTRRQWQPGQVFEVAETEAGVLLRPRPPFPPTQLDDVGRFLNYQGPLVPLEDLGIERLSYEDPYEDEADDRG